MNAQTPIVVAAPAPGTATVVMPDGSSVVRNEPKIPLRTSAKVVLTSVIGGVPLVQALQELHFSIPWLEQIWHTTLFVQLSTIAIAYAVARVTKSPLDGGGAMGGGGS